ncbi:MAG: hypothetical protein ABIT38_23500 [Gemmatimonadaceae bacterium]
MLSLLALHTWAVWGYTGPFWGDLGRWSHEVDRFANGELPYRDFQWHFPPLGMWVEGTMAKVIGSSRDALSVIAVTLAAALVVAFVHYSRRVIERRDIVLNAVLFVLAISYAQASGPSLPAGLYTPATLVGVVSIAVAAALFLKHNEEATTWTAYSVAIFCAFAVLSKQDFWLPAALLMMAITGPRRRADLVAMSALVVAAGIGVIVWTAGGRTLIPLLGGFGHAGVTAGRGLPSWERFTVDFFVLALLCGLYAVLASVARRRLLLAPLCAAALVVALTGGLHVFESMRTVLPSPSDIPSPTQSQFVAHLQKGEPLLHPAVRLLGIRAARAPIPFFLAPLLLLAMLIRWRKLPHARRVTLALLLGFAITLRLRRAFEASEWFEFLFTVPVVLASLELLFPIPALEQRRLRIAATSVLALGALAAHTAYGHGWGTYGYYRRGLSTTRGEVHWAAGTMRDYSELIATLDSIDASRARPLLAFGYSGGFNYFLKRRNAFPITQDFFFSAFNADSLLRSRPPGIFLIDIPWLRGRSFEATRFDWRSWEQPREAAPYDWYDFPRFEKFRAGCSNVPLPHSGFRLYACP